MIGHTVPKMATVMPRWGKASGGVSTGRKMAKPANKLRGKG